MCIYIKYIFQEELNIEKNFLKDEDVYVGYKWRDYRPTLFVTLGY